ncbi:hypothetical protein B0H11DRAFT_2291816, partial [Mycena galericulata]
MDLVNIRRVCRFFYMALEATPEAWTLARQHMDDIPAPPAVFASGFWGETAYANFIFGSSLCIVCSRLCQGLPSCFALNFRCCSTRCKDRVENGHIVSLIHWTLAAAAYSESYEALGFYEWLPPTHRVGTFLPRDTVLAKAEEIKQAKETSLSGLALPPAFVLRSYEELLEEWSRRLNSWPSILQNGIELAEWAEQYKVTTSLRRYWAHTDSVYPITDVMDTPTATNIISVFTRDQTVVDSATWHRSLSNINNELWALERERHSFMPELVIIYFAAPSIWRVHPDADRLRTPPTWNSLPHPNLCGPVYRAAASARFPRPVSVRPPILPTSDRQSPSIVVALFGSQLASFLYTPAKPILRRLWTPNFSSPRHLRSDIWAAMSQIMDGLIRPSSSDSRSRRWVAAVESPTLEALAARSAYHFATRSAIYVIFFFRIGHRMCCTSVFLQDE